MSRQSDVICRHCGHEVVLRRDHSFSPPMDIAACSVCNYIYEAFRNIPGTPARDMGRMIFDLKQTGTVH